MAIQRNLNILGQQRIDVPHLRSIESGVAEDFDILAGRILAGEAPLIVKGFTIGVTSTVGTLATALQLTTAGAIALHYGASEAGTIYRVPSSQAAETLNSTNTNVTGSFTVSSDNYIGIDLLRTADSTTNDKVAFLDADDGETEFFKTVPTARVMSYKIVISSSAFSNHSNVAPIAIVSTDGDNKVVSITDARRLLFRLGSGGDVPNADAVYSWAASRTENAITFSGGSDPFVGEDKSIDSLKDWMNAVMTRLWELSGGAHWYSLNGSLRSDGVISGCEVTEVASPSTNIAIAAGAVVVGGSYTLCPAGTFNALTDPATHYVYWSGSTGAWATTTTAATALNTETNVPVAVVEVAGANSTVHDIRKFVGDIDNKLILTIGSDATRSHFTTIQAAVDWFNYQQSNSLSPKNTAEFVLNDPITITAAVDFTNTRQFVLRGGADATQGNDVIGPQIIWAYDGAAFDLGNAKECVFENIHFTHTGTSAAGGSICFTSTATAANITIRGCSTRPVAGTERLRCFVYTTTAATDWIIENNTCEASDVAVDFAASATRCIIKRNYFKHGTGAFIADTYCVLLNGAATDCIVSENTIGIGGGTGFEYPIFMGSSSSVRNRICSNSIRFTGTAGIAPILITTAGNNNIVSNNNLWCADTLAKGMTINGTNTTVSNNNIVLTAVTTATVGIESLADFSTFSDNVIDMESVAAIGIHSAGSDTSAVCDNTVLLDNTAATVGIKFNQITAPNTCTGNTVKAGTPIYINICEGVTVSGNTLNPNNTATDCITLAGACANISITGNTITGVTKSILYANTALNYSSFNNNTSGSLTISNTALLFTTSSEFVSVSNNTLYAIYDGASTNVAAFLDMGGTASSNFTISGNNVSLVGVSSHANMVVGVELKGIRNTFNGNNFRWYIGVTKNMFLVRNTGTGTQDDGSVIENNVLRFNQTANAPTCKGIEAVSTQDISIVGNKIQSYAATGINIDANSHICLINGNMISSLSATNNPVGIVCSANNANISGNTVISFVTGIQVTGTYPIITLNKCIGPTTGIDCSTATQPVIKGNTTNATTTAIKAFTDSTITGNGLFGNNTAASVGILFSAATTGCSISDNKIYRYRTAIDGSTCTIGSISGNNISYDGGDTTTAGILISDDMAVCGNSIIGKDTAASNGILCSAGTTGCTISNNKIGGYVTGIDASTCILSSIIGNNIGSTALLYGIKADDDSVVSDNYILGNNPAVALSAGIIVADGTLGMVITGNRINWMVSSIFDGNAGGVGGAPGAGTASGTVTGNFVNNYTAATTGINVNTNAAGAAGALWIRNGTDRGGAYNWF